MENHFYHIKLSPLIVTIFITHVRNLHNGRYANDTFQMCNNKGQDQTVHMCMLVCNFIVHLQQSQAFFLQGPFGSLYSDGFAHTDKGNKDGIVHHIHLTKFLIGHSSNSLFFTKC